MPRLARNVFLSVAFFVGSTLTTSAYLTPQETSNFNQAFNAANNKDWKKAYQLADEVNDPVAYEIIQWLHLRSGVEQWNEYWRFTNQDVVWPGMKILRKSGETALSGNENPYQVIEYFNSYFPQTGKGALHYARALKKVGKTKEADRVIRDSFLSLPFERQEFKQTLKEFPQSTKALLPARMNNLIWLNQLSQAKMVRPYLTKDYQALLDARIAVKTDGIKVDALIRSVPSDLRDNSGLDFDRMIWRFNNNAIERGIDLFLANSKINGDLEDSVFWSDRRFRTAHSLMQEKRYEEAYKMASGHNLTTNGVLKPIKFLSELDRISWEKTQRYNYLELEWLSGFIALRKLNNPEQALTHFYNYYTELNEPSIERANHSVIRQGKAGYWLGLTHEVLGNPKDAIIAYQFGAKFQTSFYGQLAAKKINAPLSKLITRKEPYNQDLINELSQDKIVRAALIFDDIDVPHFGAWFFAHKAEYVDRAGIAALARIARSNGSEFSALKIAKQGAVQGDVVVEFLYPLTKESGLKFHISPALATAVIRQESEFLSEAVSRKGAIGLMQILPSTGKPIAKDYGINWSTKNILFDREYNLKIGTAYMNTLLEEFDNSNVLAFSSYNAGPGRVTEWFNSIGDPRKRGISDIDWVEHIPYYETRNYVMRVSESFKVYQILLGVKDSL